ncbi:hypothetical protein [Tepidibacter formicigenes]|jgi:hypothetical protein|uniref:Uncharacterized protein n=1 Tax=Tepidibacter formicigenes DSM 15518 TaxID=1123349 RepID=A0A1M6TK05_9FIRM|nr:hypothetical protein [Tepidibacter formicigenes]SHK57236.1 hypothetical protein SAMN02744037_02618 [Tepidibacter formicigenes DSM 15518]
MFSIIRRGPKSLIIESKNIDKLKEYFVNELKAIKEASLTTAFQEAGEEYTIIFLVEKVKEVVKCSECIDTLIIKEDPDIILCKVLNNKIKEDITFSRIAPRIIFMRIFGDIDKILVKVKEDYKAVEGNIIDLLDNYNDKGTILAFTEKPLNKIMYLEDIHEKSLFIEEKYSDIFKKLRIHALKYLNAGLDNRDWYEIEIKIYDRYGAYKLHYERLLKILEGLELGFILGESWTKDYPRLFMAVGVYRVRFFTFYNPKYIKKILVGSEFLEDGMRIVDYDLYYNRKKINWTDIVEDNLRSKNLLGEKYRKEIFSKLEEKEINEILNLECEIIKTRD